MPHQAGDLPVMQKPKTQCAQKVALAEWKNFIARCIAERLEPSRFRSYSPLLQLKHPLPPVAIADLLLRPQPHNKNSLDPRIPEYLQILSEQRFVDVPSILNGLYKYSTSHTQSQGDAATGENAKEGNTQKIEPVRWKSSYGSEEVMFYHLTKAVAQGTAIRNTEDALAMVIVVSKWMTLFTNASTAFAVQSMGEMQIDTARDEMDLARAAFVALLLGVCENPVVLKAMSRPEAKATRKVISESLANFVPTIMHTADRIASRLDHFRTSTLGSFDAPEGRNTVPSAELEHLFDSGVDLDNFVISELPIVNSRAGLYIYLNAALVGRPLIDDAAIFNYLNNRYQGDVQSTTIDLILASFDVLANAVYRNEGTKSANVLRSFLMNKIPLLLVNLSKHMFPPLTAEYCITDALRRVDSNAFPTFSSTFDEGKNNNPFTDSVREEFCWACCLHGLLQERSIESILGETPYQSLPSRGRYTKEALVQECLSDPERVQSLIGELDNMDGNVGAACQAIVEVMTQLCRNKDTPTLKTICGQLARRPLSLDVLLLFEKPATILQPLTEILDNWKYEDYQGEYQPVYEEFGSILLLVLAFAYRYSLALPEVGVKTADSFVGKLLNQGFLSKPSNELSEKEKGHLDGWVRGMFDPDTGGLPDDLISSCPPQEFYLLGPTLFQQIVMAVGTGYLTGEGLKGGIEYLVETFLLPSLVTAILNLSNQLWVDRQYPKATLQILNYLVQPGTVSAEALGMHSAVLNIVAKPLEHSLRAYQRQNPTCQEVEPLLKAVKDNLPLSRRTGSADHNELEVWSSTPHGGLTASIRGTIQGLVQWSLQAAMNSTPAPYTHRMILVALKMFGAKRLLHVLYEEVRQQTEQGSGSMVYDVVTALICAPDIYNVPQLMPPDSALGDAPVPVQRGLSLREVLKLEAEDCKKLQKTDMAQAELVVRLHRKVETQMVISQPEPMQGHHQGMLAGDLGLSLDGDQSASLDNAMAAAAAAAGAEATGGLNVDNVSLDLGMGGMGGDLGLGDAGAGVSLDLGGDDMFSGLSGGGDFDWDAMDMS